LNEGGCWYEEITSLLEYRIFFLHFKLHYSHKCSNSYNLRRLHFSPGCSSV